MYIQLEKQTCFHVFFLTTFIVGSSIEPPNPRNPFINVEVGPGWRMPGGYPSYPPWQQWPQQQSWHW